MDHRKKITLVAPFYNEEAGVARFFERIDTALAPIRDHYDLEVVCVNDGSRDHTLEMLKQAREGRSYIRIVDFSRNFGKEAAITAGLDFATGDAVVPIDSDLQHPPELVLQMIDEWEAGYEAFWRAG